MQLKDAVIVSAVRSAGARGKKDGGFATVHAVDLSAEMLEYAAKRAKAAGAAAEFFQASMKSLSLIRIVFTQ
jgi:acetyl-CoA acyltransferase